MSDSISCTSDSSQKQLTFQEYQTLYHELTNKNESLTKGYAKSFSLNKNQIRHLNELITSCLGQYVVVAKNTNVVVYQSDNTKKVYSSIENFFAIETTSKATESMSIEYDVLIEASNTNAKHNYKLVIKATSDLIAFEEMKDNLPPELLDFVDKKNIGISIEYIDYTIAKNLLHTFEEWINDISSKDNIFFNILSKYKNILSKTIKNIFMFFTFILIYVFIPKYINSTNIDMQLTIKYIIVSLGILYFSDRFSILLSNQFKLHLLHLGNFSSINLTPTDEKNIAQYNRNFKWKLFRIFFAVLMTLVYGVISSVIATKYFHA